MSKTKTHYGDGTNEPNVVEYVYDAVLAGDSDIIYSQYDNNGDGYVNAVVLIHPGAAS